MCELRAQHLIVLLSLTLLALQATACESTSPSTSPDSDAPVGFADVPAVGDTDLVTPDTTDAPDAVPDAQPDTEPDTQPDATPDAEPDATPDATPDVTPDASKPDAECVPDCSGKTCGPNGCGGLCGFCTHPKVCDEFGQCVSICVTDCEGKTCGPDGCGGVCGTCEDGLVCGEEDQNCFQPDCVPDCDATGAVCGPDGCGSTCGDCAAPKICEEGACFLGPCGVVDEQGGCQGDTAVWCEDKVNLIEDDCSLKEDHKCAFDVNTQKWACVVKGPCEPSCANKTCGDDGCGGICAPGCPSGWSCAVGNCKPEPGASCGSITKAGQCDGTVVWFCSSASNKLTAIECADFGQTCKWDQSQLAFDCQ